MRSRRKKIAKPRWQRFLWGAGVLLALALIAAIAMLERVQRTPRELAPYVLKRSSGHNDVIEGIGRWTSDLLLHADRGDWHVNDLPALKIGVQPESAKSSASPIRIVTVGSAEQAKQAIAAAQAGDAITFLPGHYKIAGAPYLALNKAGTQEHPISLRAERANTVFLEFDMAEGLLVSAPYWIVENLSIQGICPIPDFCEHALHIVGNAHHFVARNNLIRDFNSHVKINLSDGSAPDFGVLESNSLTNTAVRHTEHPVTLIDLVGASQWQIRRNIISDFIKEGGDRTSYGAFAKGAGADNQIVQNIVICELHLRGNVGQRVGLSLGGGGTGAPYCRDKRCVTEQDRGVIDSNLIAACSDNGIYLNRAAASKVTHNTLIETGGVLLRFPETSADLQANLIDGAVLVRDEAVLREEQDKTSAISSLFVGWHPVRSYFSANGDFNLRWRSDPPNGSIGAASTDLCGAVRPPQNRAGAFEDFGKCLRGD